MSQRPHMSKKLRFEVFKRDAFTCQYCGRKAPEIVLQCDHIKAVAEGGTTDILNLVTSCVDCNAGKGARSLSEQATLSKQMDQLAELQARREQIEMLIDWRSGLEKLKEDSVESAAEAWERVTEGAASLTKTGKDRLRKLIKEYGLDLVLQAMPETIDSYGKRDGERYTLESAEFAFNKLGGVARVIRDSKDKPYLRQIFYIRGILRGRLSYVDDREALRLMEEAAQCNVDFKSVEGIARRVRSWSAFRDALESYIREYRDKNK